MIDAHHLPELKNNLTAKLAPFQHGMEEITKNQPLSQMMEEYEARIIKQTLFRLNGNKTLTAKMLGLSVRNLYYKLEKYKLEKNSMQ